MRSGSSRSTGRVAKRRPRAGGVDVYLLPAVVGGGLGDVEEVLAAGRRLARAGYSIALYRRSGRPLPPGVDGPWDWPAHTRLDRLAPAAPAAMTITPAWGVSAAPAGPPPLGRPGRWAEEVSDIERAYGAERTVHVSLEEFARTLSLRRETVERFREGGVRARAIPARVARARDDGEVAAFDRAFRRFRAFDRPNVLHLFATFRPDRRFAREFPEAVQVGPLWSDRRSGRLSRPAMAREWVWYASPASAESILPDVERGLDAAGGAVRLFVRTPRPWRRYRPGPRTTVTDDAIPPRQWWGRFARADLRIVTGSRSLLEAIEVGGPFLYFNGVLGEGSAAHRHRPEKIVALLGLATRTGWPADVRRDLADFASARRVAAVAERAARRDGGWARPRRPLRPVGFLPPFDDAGAVIEQVAAALAEPGSRADAIVARWRSGQNA